MPQLTADCILRRTKEDVLTDLALATYPDGNTPEVTAVVRTATFLFAAGQETTARLLAAALKHLAEHPELQDELRANRDRISDFLEEVLRTESPVKTDFRLARRSTSISRSSAIASGVWTRRTSTGTERSTGSRGRAGGPFRSGSRPRGHRAGPPLL